MITTINEFMKIFENSDDIKSFINRESYFELDDSDEDSITFITRENGDVGSERPGRADVVEANRLKNLVENKFGLDCEIETVDEWVYLRISL